MRTSFRKVSLKRLGWVSSSLLVAGAGFSSALAACGGDDNAVHAQEGGLDGTVDGTSDVVTSDTLSPEAATDGGADAGDGGALDAPMDVQYDVPPLDQYPHAVDLAYCQRVQQCCLVPADQWDVAGCAKLLDMYGGALRTGIYASAFDGGNVSYDPAQASTCFGEIAAFNCGLSSTSAYAMAVIDCNAAIVGTIAIDARGCTSSVECVTGAYCNVAADGGPGTCAALQPSGGPCTNPTSEQCTYLGNGQPPLYCNIQGDSGSGQCTGAKPADAGCSTNAECSTGYCGAGRCLSQTLFGDPGVQGGFCDHFTIKDAGGEGG